MYLAHSPSVRKFVNPPLRKESQLAYRIASNRQELRAAYRLVYDRYLEQGLISPNQHKMWVTPYQLLPTTQTFIAIQKQEVVCTVSLIGDGELGLPMESVYSEEINDARSRGLYMGEVSCLASRHEDLRQFLPLFVQLTRLMAQHARRQGMDQFMIAVHPNHAKFYERCMGFEQIGPLREFPSVHDAPAVAYCLDFARMDRERPHFWNKFFGLPLPDSTLVRQPISLENAEYFRPATKVTQAYLSLMLEACQ